MQDARPSTHALHAVGVHVPPLDEVDEPEPLDPPDTVHEPAMHVCPVVVQSVQLPLPGWPHAVSAVPRWHVAFESQQPLGQSHVAPLELALDPELPEVLPELPPPEPELPLEPPPPPLLPLELVLAAPSSEPPSNVPTAPLHPQTTAQAANIPNGTWSSRTCKSVPLAEPQIKIGRDVSGPAGPDAEGVAT